MLKVFISQPMQGKTDAEISQERQRIIDEIHTKYNEAVAIDSFFAGTPGNNNPVWWLSKSIEHLSEADAVYFAPGWETARGCKIEHTICEEYGIKFIHD